MKRILFSLYTLIVLAMPLTVLPGWAQANSSNVCSSGDGDCRSLEVTLEPPAGQRITSPVTVMANRVYPIDRENKFNLDVVAGSNNLKYHAGVIDLTGSNFPGSCSYQAYSPKPLGNGSNNSNNARVFAISISNGAKAGSFSTNICGGDTPDSYNSPGRTVTVSIPVTLDGKANPAGGISGTVKYTDPLINSLQNCGAGNQVQITGPNNYSRRANIGPDGTSYAGPQDITVKGTYTVTPICSSTAGNVSGAGTVTITKTVAITKLGVYTKLNFDGSEKATPGGTSTIDPTAGSAAAADSNQIQCDGGGLTWVICPLIIGASKTIDGSKAILQNLLIVQPLSGASTDATYAIWKNIRNFADIIFVLIFLVVIFGTSFGLDNYTVKKTLPRLIAAAILVQFSYFLAGFVIDIGNVLGGGMEALATASGIKAPLFDFAQGGQVGGLVLAFSAAGLLAVGAIMLSFTAIIGAVIAILVVILSLIARQILISLLIILSPIAMVMWVLPNTEKGFKLWYKSLFQVVMLYPIIMLLFIAGRLFSVAATAAHQSEVFAVIGYILPLFLVPMAFKSAGTLFNLASKGVGKVGGLANSQVGRGSNFDKKRAENRQYNSAQRAGDAKTAFGRSINSKRAGFGFAPSPLQQSAMAGVVKKGDTARLDMADRKLENLNADQLKATALSSSSSALTKRAAVSRLADKSDTGALTEILASGALGSTDASHPEWQKAIGSKASDLVKTAPHLVLPGAGVTKMYLGMGAESVAGLSAAGFEKWKTATDGTSRQQDIARTIASSAPLMNKITEERRVELNTTTGGTMAGGETHYIPTSNEAQINAQTAKVRVANEAQAAAVYDVATSVNDIHTTLSDPARSAALPTGVTPADVRDHALTNELYRRSVEHAVVTGGVVPAPPARPVTTKVDPMSQGEVKIPGDDRSVS